MTGPEKLEGEALAAAVAVEVMGWHKATGQLVWWDDRGATPYGVSDHPESYRTRGCHYRPHRDWNQAMEAAAGVCRKLDCSIAVSMYVNCDNDLIYTAEISHPDGRWGPVSSSMSGPTTVSRATLKTVRAAKEKTDG